ncbi:hypothetical protein KC19_9G132300 [Ceratodon purpureus]|uniref:F-box domain-containing protein n=1 Tax=Ceratodon purpureus TaxID=3225 RepID=A0A8T0GV97_CERPU|nr:hypothetical protein KC19_9G132300 [Ceratodon purpureus]
MERKKKLVMGRELDPKLWRHLPAEILVGHVLRWLPYPTQCKFRAVCKHWNSLPALRGEDAYLLDIPCNSPEDALRFCYLYSPLLNIWSEIDLSFMLATMSRFGYRRSPWKFQVDRYCSDGGLLCVWGKITKDDVRRPQRGFVEEYHFVVVNPVTKRSKLLPTSPYMIDHKPEDLVMHRESSGSYKIFATWVVSMQALRLVMYDSASNEWKVLRTFTSVTEVRCSIIFEGVFYCLLSFSLGVHDLFAYDIVQDAWYVHGEKQHSGDPVGMKVEHWLMSCFNHPSFVVRKGSLLLVASGWDEALLQAFFCAHKLDLSGTTTMIASTRCVPRPKSIGSWTWISGAAFEYGDSIILASNAKRRVAVVDLFSWAQHLSDVYLDRDINNLPDDLPSDPEPRRMLYPNGLKPITPLVKRPKLHSKYYLDNMKKVTFDMQAVP